MQWRWEFTKDQEVPEQVFFFFSFVPDSPRYPQPAHPPSLPSLLLSSLSKTKIELKVTWVYNRRPAKNIRLVHESVRTSGIASFHFLLLILFISLSLYFSFYFFCFAFIFANNHHRYCKHKKRDVLMTECTIYKETLSADLTSYTKTHLTPSRSPKGNSFPFFFLVFFYFFVFVLL